MKGTYTINLNSRKFNSIEEVEEYTKNIKYWISEMESKRKGKGWITKVTLTKL